MDYACGVWSNDAFGDRGWLAIALVIFTIWRPNVSVLASFLFGGLYILYLYLPTGMDHMENQELYKKYAELAGKEENVIFGGRLAEYRYYDMDKVIESAFSCVKKEFGNE